VKTTEEQLMHHWMMDVAAAQALSDQAGKPLATLVDVAVSELSEDAVSIRDQHRKNITSIFAGKSAAKLVVIGPCSLDMNVDYEPVFDLIEEIQSEHPNDLVAMRANGSKPRSSTGWRGLWHGLDAAHRQRLHQIHQQAFERGVPILTEITEGQQLSALAPRLSAAWIGARDIESSSLRSMFSAFQLPVGLKNGVNGDLTIVRHAKDAIAASSDDMGGCGVDVGVFHALDSGSVLAGNLPVSVGNNTTAIIARGHNLGSSMLAEEREQAAIDHLNSAFETAQLLGSVALIDGTHDVPKMFDVERARQDRFLRVVEKFCEAHEAGRMPLLPICGGLLAEIGPVVGRTDPNMLITDENVSSLKLLLNTFLNLRASEDVSDGKLTPTS
jgi:3-deoxy-7-phosphoheptulonate synthase